ncbi:aspartyl-tRNA(Asn)/glutamyl-tRNA(Gln) amidotransferase subunit A [Bryocella elongata]|uniref:Aspartyl-tRNA(Asn)/glutamyl-tRNA(Gln) amidotransferase subunit A n=1 Tax=Bryocella elongata TaxID=863522 RepID=A0A1H6B0C3_9BACT|nr:amidase [Bryocella elongata]SEG54082.1 aspartyl-tRNA(Asn)/glutamyl-tRNA(Gln) amidotransferase subunit A [Bryocella elongata]
MPVKPSPITALRSAFGTQESSPEEALQECLSHANSNAGKNVYLAQDAAWSQGEAAKLTAAGDDSQPLFGIPVSLKDCFDLEGFATSCGSKFYEQSHGIAVKDSVVAKRLKAAGAVITGKTHLHMLAYGITGENRDYGHCLQPRDASLLTGGSSSGAAASVQEGSAIAAIGTDTGGSIRVPAALCGIAGYRSSVKFCESLWDGGAHLAETFDSIGWLYGDLRDGPVLGKALFGFDIVEAPKMSGLRIGYPHAHFLRDTEPLIFRLQRIWLGKLNQLGATVEEFDATFWEPAMEIFAPIQAHEAAGYHRGNFDKFEQPVAERLKWGESITDDEIASLGVRLNVFRQEMRELMERFDYLLLPASPVSALKEGEDLSDVRAQILRYTVPMSMTGTPALTMPGSIGGVQLVGRIGEDAALLALTAKLNEIVRSEGLEMLQPGAGPQA